MAAKWWLVWNECGFYPKVSISALTWWWNARSCKTPDQIHRVDSNQFIYAMIYSVHSIRRQHFMSRSHVNGVQLLLTIIVYVSRRTQSYMSKCRFPIIEIESKWCSQTVAHAAECIAPGTRWHIQNGEWIENYMDMVQKPSIHRELDDKPHLRATTPNQPTNPSYVFWQQQLMTLKLSPTTYSRVHRSSFIR